MHTEQLLCWSGMTYTEHSTTSGSIEEEDTKHNFITSCLLLDYL